MKTKKRTVRYVLLGLMSLIILALILLPGIARKYIINNSKELIGRQVDMDKLRLNYFTGTVKVFDFKMYAANEKDLFFSFDTLILDTEPYKYVTNLISLDRFYLKGLNLNISKKDTIYNFDDLIAYHASEDTTTTEEDEVFKYQLSNLELKDAAVHFHDGDVEKTTSFEDLELFLPYIEWNQENDSDADFELTFSEGGELRSNFAYHPQTGNYEGTITIEALELSPFYNYAAQFAEISKLDGHINTTIHLSGNTEIPEDLLVTGDVDLIDFAMSDKGGQKFLGSGKVHCNLEEILYSKSSYIIGDLQIEQPYLKFEMDSVSNNLFRIFKLNEGEEIAETGSEDDPNAKADAQTKAEANESDNTPTNANDETSGNIYYALKHMSVKGGVLEYRDNLTGQPFDYFLSEITMDTDSIYSDSEWVDIRSDMLLNERGTLKASVGFDPQDPMELDIDIAIKEFLLSDLNIYSKHYTGHSILNGDMFYFTNSQVTNGQITSENQLLIKNVSVENTKGGLWSLPLKLAVFILKDKNGDIELDVPVRGNLNNPEVDVWDLVGTTLKKKIFDATDNPARSLAKLVDAEPEDLEAVLLSYPDTVLTEDHQRQLDLILELEGKKEGLGIAMNYVFDAEALHQADSSQADTTAMSRQAVAVDSLDANSKQKSLPRASVATDSTSANRQGENTAGQPADSLLAGYGEVMISKIKRYLDQKDPNTQITVQMAALSDASAVDAPPQFKVKYSLREASENAAEVSKDSLPANTGNKERQ
ncbi:DUF748 domain-containing protein [Robertkochia sediminum]|uniref:DUF748 domain-containing protein n=1 Tax=Robertkochia sediminum TaxID=2785326 RepID=UPI00193456EA|nr:DUF748 domain-containing protein [Robertkochia sediminum]MBL7473245.1 DUF748 domain-containing protein [Robertkochia sediminum]